MSRFNLDQFLFNNRKPKRIMRETTSRYQCTKCDKIFTKLEKAQRPRSGNRRFPCVEPECTKVYATQNQLTDHINVIHKNLRPHKCDRCEMTFGRLGGLRRHVTMVHDNVTFKCPYEDCDHPGYKCSKALTAHIRSKHTFVRPYECLHCQKTFVRNNDLKSDSFPSWSSSTGSIARERRTQKDPNALLPEPEPVRDEADVRQTVEADTENTFSPERKAEVGVVLMRLLLSPIVKRDEVPALLSGIGWDSVRDFKMVNKQLSTLQGRVDGLLYFSSRDRYLHRSKYGKKRHMVNINKKMDDSLYAESIQGRKCNFGRNRMIISGRHFNKVRTDEEKMLLLGTIIHESLHCYLCLYEVETGGHGPLFGIALASLVERLQFPGLTYRHCE